MGAHGPLIEMASRRSQSGPDETCSRRLVGEARIPFIVPLASWLIEIFARRSRHAPNFVSQPKIALPGNENRQAHSAVR